jgi:Ca2+-binding EF-hand superfamily protein
MIGDLEAEVAKVKGSCAPLLEEGGAKFLAGATVNVIAEALKEHLQKTSSTKDAFFKEAAGGKEKIAKDEFLTFLDKLPEKLSSEELAFPEEQRDGIFAHIDADKDGEISLADFESMFQVRYMCVSAISITDGFEIAKSKTVVKLELDDVVEIVGEEQKLPNGVSRIECKTVESGKQGWVTMKGNQGTQYLEVFSAYNTFVKSTDRLIEGVTKTLGKTTLS